MLFIVCSFLLFFSSSSEAATTAEETSTIASKTAQPSSKKKYSEKYITFLKVAGGIAIPLFVVGECIMYTQFVKATYLWITHGKRAQSFFKKQPKGATYELTCTVKRFGDGYEKTFHSQDPHLLIIEANNHIAHYIKKNYPHDLFVRVFLQPVIITRQGKRITLSPFYNLWNARKGLIKELKATFITSPVNSADQMLKAVQRFTVGSLMTLTAPLIVTAAYKFRGYLSTSKQSLPSVIP